MDHIELCRVQGEVVVSHVLQVVATLVVVLAHGGAVMR